MEVFSISVNCSIEVNAWCDVFSRFVAVGTFVSVGVVCSDILCL